MLNRLCCANVCSGSRSWMPAISDYYQWLIINFRRMVKITAIATQGLANSRNLASEYIVLYSIDGSNFMSYTTTSGEDEVRSSLIVWHADFVMLSPLCLAFRRIFISLGLEGLVRLFLIYFFGFHHRCMLSCFRQHLLARDSAVSVFVCCSQNGDLMCCLFQLFKGNSDGGSVKINKFETPIIARYIKINPTRWVERISLRVELYGCNYGNHVLFNLCCITLFADDKKKRRFGGSKSCHT